MRDVAHGRKQPPAKASEFTDLDVSWFEEPVSSDAWPKDGPLILPKHNFGRLDHYGDLVETKLLCRYDG